MLDAPGLVGNIGKTRRWPTGSHGTWHPWQLSGLARDWDAAGLADGAVASWMDEFAGHQVTQGTGAAQPIKAATSFNSAYPGVTFDGTDDYLETTTLTGIPTGATAGEMWIVASWVDTGALGVGIGYGATGTVQRVLRKVAGGALGAFDGATALNASGGTGNRIWGASWSGTEMRGYRDGTPLGGNPATIATLATATTRLRIGSSPVTTPGSFGNLVIARAFIITGLLSTQDRQRLEGYCAHTYGLLSLLPSNHPYKVWAP